MNVCVRGCPHLWCICVHAWWRVCAWLRMHVVLTPGLSDEPGRFKCAVGQASCSEEADWRGGQSLSWSVQA